VGYRSPQCFVLFDNVANLNASQVSVITTGTEAYRDEIRAWRYGATLQYDDRIKRDIHVDSWMSYPMFLNTVRDAFRIPYDKNIVGFYMDDALMTPASTHQLLESMGEKATETTKYDAHTQERDTRNSITENKKEGTTNRDLVPLVVVRSSAPSIFGCIAGMCAFG
jgi:hypothetical protein